MAKDTDAQIDPDPLEVRVASVGFWLVGIAVAVTTVSYVQNMTFPYQWLVWLIAAVFAAVALLAFEWPRALRSSGDIPGRLVRQLLLLSIPFAFLLSSQVCGLGTRACSAVCHATNLSLIGLGAIIAVQLHRGRRVGLLLVPLVVIGLIPHCVCHAPINLLWHGMLGGIAPTCEMVPLAAALFAMSALRGARPKASAVLVAAMLGVMVFIIVGGLLFGFPWEGCVTYPA